MPIGDLLAEITGKPGAPSTPSSANPNASASSGLKRKASASSSLSSGLTKKPAIESNSTLARSTPSSYNSASASSSIRKSDSLGTNSQRPNGSPAANTNTLRNGVSGSAQARKTGYEPPRPRPMPSNQSAPTASARPVQAVTRPTPSTSQAPKKGSFAEIMARGAKAQQTMGKVGVIQHKSIGKQMSKKDRELAKTEQKNSAKMAAGKGVAGPGKGSATISRAAESSRSGMRGGSNGDRPIGSKAGVKSTSAEVPEKKIKKSSSATTGYTGTARPIPGAAKRGPTGRSGGPARPGQRDRGLLAPPKAARKDRYDDEYDEELDDFIDYDDEEAEADPYGRPGRYVEYDSDASSDMEAGLSDIDSEERRAERVARDEDRREKMLEEKLKREKEERRKRLAQGYR